MTWHRRAACRGMNVDTFFPDPQDHPAVDHAKSICATCPVLDDCLTTYIHENHGIFGGTTRTERRLLRAELGIGPAERPLPDHGTESRYRHHGCKCERCLIACREAERWRRARRERLSA